MSCLALIEAVEVEVQADHAEAKHDLTIQLPRLDINVLFQAIKIIEESNHPKESSHEAEPNHHTKALLDHRYY